MSPNRSIHRSDKAPGSAEPETASTRSFDRSYRPSVSSGSSRIRCIITGTTISAVHSCRAVSESVASGSNLRLRTSVDERLMPSVKCTKPQEWNIGAAIIVFSRAFSGIIASRAAAGSSDRGCEREAPLGVPVVPEVRMIALPRSLGGRTLVVSPLLDEVLEQWILRPAGVGVVPGDESLAPPSRLLDQLVELVVVDQRLRLLALGDVGELRRRRTRC